MIAHLHQPVTTAWTPERVLDRMRHSRRFVERAILALHHQQSPAQQNGEDTDAPRDRVGFNRFDKDGLLGDLARQLEVSRDPEGHRLTDRQLYYGVIKLRPYATQLANLANRNEALEVASRRAPLQAFPCEVCGGTQVVEKNVFGERLLEPCPRCGDTPYRG